MEKQITSKYKQDTLKTPDVRKMSKTSKFIRVVAMIFKVLSMIMFVSAIIMTVASFVFAGRLLVERDTIWNGVQTLETFVKSTYGISIFSLSFAFMNIAIFAAGVIPVAWFSWRLFGNIFRNKTPYTYKTARAAIRLAIIAGGCGVVGSTFFGIMWGIYSLNFGAIDTIGYVYFPHIVYGIVMVIFSFLCRHGAELRYSNKEVAEKLAAKK